MTAAHPGAAEECEPSIEERALRAILGNQVEIMRALAQILERSDPGTRWLDERMAQDLRDRVKRCEEWKSAHLRN